ncbi:MAG: UDP-4-amino-4,6-dideoxy-N-acetyl-beta-L-altrosamine transaminase [Gammaproteobacteria bacterium]|nr:UDP-4-amino-4,6-dideoxy-N-acetyl-beta-L-altrosamine transaminase [Gammaproteobacteria bacterium]
MLNKLAIEGGVPVREKMLAYGRQSISKADIETVMEVLNSDWLTTGPKVSEFEAQFAESVDAKYAIAVNSGTAALHTALFAAGVAPGSEVITTPFTFVATANVVRYLGGTVKFVDIRADTYNIDHNKIEESINKKTKAIIAVDFAGHPADFNEIKAIADKHNLIVVEDAAHSLGATYKNRKVGSLADMTTFSFHPVKHITTGEGGMIATDDAKFAAKMRAFRNHGITLDHKQREEAGSFMYDMTDLGFNYRLTDIQSALGISQLKKLNLWVQRRREIAAMYTAAFIDYPEIITPVTLPECESSWHLYVVQLVLECLTVNRGQIFHALRAENIGVNVHYIPVPWHSYYQNLGYTKGQWPIAEKLYERIISLPMWPGMSDKDIQETIIAVKKVISAYRK